MSRKLLPARLSVSRYDWSDRSANWIFTSFSVFRKPGPVLSELETLACSHFHPVTHPLVPLTRL